MRILFIEDNQELAEQLADALREMRYAIDLATDGQQGWDFLRSTSYDLVLMDVMLPKLDGVSLCHRIRSAGYQIPILMLTARSTSQDQVHGLDSGADDYMIKPVGINELSARIRALLRRGGAAIAPVLSWGNLQLDPSQCEVRYADRKLPVTPKEYALLELMMRNSQQVLSRKAILQGLWSYDEDVPEEDTIKAHIKGVRRKLKSVGAEDLIETIYGVGYRLNPTYLETAPSNPTLDVDHLAQAADDSQVPQQAHLTDTTAKLKSTAPAQLLSEQTACLLIEKLLHLAHRYQHPFCYAHLQIDSWNASAPEMQAVLLEQVGQLLQYELSVEDTVASAGGGNFVLGMYGVTCSEVTERLATILEALRSSSVPGLTHPQPLTFSAGVAAYPTHGTTLEDLAQLSQAALQQAKMAGGDRILTVGWQPVQPDKTVLLVHPDADYAQQVTQTLETRGYHIEWLREGSAAIDKLTNPDCPLQAPVVLLSDQLPDLPALGVLEKIQKAKKRTSLIPSKSRIILLSFETQTIEHAMERGAFDYITSPQSLSILVQRLHRAMT